MTVIEKLKSAQTSEDFAKIVGYKTSGLSYILYHMSDRRKYTEFYIPKKSGGHRTIRAPRKELKLLQRRVSNILYLALEENESKDRQYKSVSHGFSKNQSTITNALCHKRRRYVFNLDLSDFFDTINFGRVRGVLINDQKFALHPNIATIITQIACSKNVLPQGSPCSPVLSNIVGRLLDVRLVRLARKFKCTYSRYADDITFSTNQKTFPSGLACPDPASPGKWIIGSSLSKEVLKTGFNINANKTRMQFRTSRQTVTGLVTNTKVNICSDYYRTVRAMCHTFFSTGSYYRMMPAPLVGGKETDPNVRVEIKSSACLEGMLGYV